MVDQALKDQYLRVEVEVEKLCSLLNVTHYSCEGCDNWGLFHTTPCCLCSLCFEADQIANYWEPRKKQETKKVEASSHE